MCLILPLVIVFTFDLFEFLIEKQSMYVMYKQCDYKFYSNVLNCKVWLIVTIFSIQSTVFNIFLLKRIFSMPRSLLYIRQYISWNSYYIVLHIEGNLVHYMIHSTRMGTFIFLAAAYVNNTELNILKWTKLKFSLIQQ